MSDVRRIHLIVLVIQTVCEDLLTLAAEHITSASHCENQRSMATEFLAHMTDMDVQRSIAGIDAAPKHRGHQFIA